MARDVEAIERLVCAARAFADAEHRLDSLTDEDRPTMLSMRIGARDNALYELKEAARGMVTR